MAVRLLEPDNDFLASQIVYLFVCLHQDDLQQRLCALNSTQLDELSGELKEEITNDKIVQIVSLL